MKTLFGASAMFLIAARALLRWAVTVHVSGFNLQGLGLALFVIGIVGLVISFRSCRPHPHPHHRREG